MRRRRNPEVIAGRVNADGSIAAGDGFTVQKGTTGNYTVTFPASFRLLTFVPATTTGSAYMLATFAITATSAAVANFNSSTLAYSDQPWQFTATGTQQ